MPHKKFKQIKNKILNSVLEPWPRLELGFEMWEILTAFTIALTLASILLWFSSLAPRHLEREFVWQEKNKNTLYNLNKEVYFLNKTNPSFLSSNSTIDSVCKLNTPQEINKESYFETQARFSNIKEGYQKIKVDFNNYNSYLVTKPNFLELIDVSESYISKSNAILEKKNYLSTIVQNLRNRTLTLCSPENLELEKLLDFEFLVETLEELKNFKVSEKEKVIEIISNLKAIAEKLKGYSWSDVSEENKQIIINEYAQLWKLEAINFDNSSLGNEYEEILKKFLEYENWQLSVIHKRKDLEKKVVFAILSKNN